MNEGESDDETDLHCYEHPSELYDDSNTDVHMVEIKELQDDSTLGIKLEN